MRRTTWKDRLLQLVLAGGATTLGGCPLFGPTCNANPDPCCSDPKGTACQITRSCHDMGLEARSTYDSDLGKAEYMCVDPTDLAAPDDLSVPVDMTRGPSDGGAHD